VKKFDDRFSRFDTTPLTDEQTDWRTELPYDVAR